MLFYFVKKGIADDHLLNSGTHLPHLFTCSLALTYFLTPNPENLPATSPSNSQDKTDNTTRQLTRSPSNSDRIPKDYSNTHIYQGLARAMKVAPIFSAFLLAAGVANAQDVPVVNEFANMADLAYAVTTIIKELGGPEVAAVRAMASANQAGTAANTATAAVSTAGGLAAASSSPATASEAAVIASESTEGDMGGVIADIIDSNKELQWLLDSGEARGRDRRLSLPPAVIQAIIQAILCIIISIVVDNVLYADLPSLCDYSDNEVCLNSTQCGADKPMIEFVSDKDDAENNKFLYAATGEGLPANLQGVFWLDYDGYCSSIVSWAETKEPFPLSTGALRDPLLPLNPAGPSLYDGFEYSIRVSGASNWAFSESQGCYDFVEGLDLIYGLRLLDGTRSDPKEFQIVPSVKIPGSCLRLSLDDYCLEDAGIDFALLRFTMTLVEVCATLDVTAQNYDTALEACDAGSTIWERRSWYFQNRNGPPSGIYYVIQIIDGSGNKIQPAYNTWVANQGDTTAPQPYINAFRSINKSSKSVKSEVCWFGKSSKSSKNCKSKSSKAKGTK